MSITTMSLYGMMFVNVLWMIVNYGTGDYGQLVGWLGNLIFIFSFTMKS